MFFWMDQMGFYDLRNSLNQQHLRYDVPLEYKNMSGEKCTPNYS